MITTADAAAFSLTIASGGVAVFPADTVYGLAAAPDDLAAVARLYELKGRQPTKPAALMFFDRDRALAALPELGPRTRGAAERLLPGGVTLLLPQPETGEGGTGADPADAPALGLRVPLLDGPLAALAGVELAVVQSSANLAGGPDPRTLADVPQAIRDGVDLVLDAGPLPGTSSTVIDLRGYERAGTWTIVRAGAVSAQRVAQTLG
ncbi:L-threonylcarbamoyladenylate synthase [Conexibacter sp. CPCC 206217]|uniref:L-threonylcarbamoyladenylate synthase n=1 Tax=Conexibacter sp. CPCC 206217 TaxID=3064574 RepID=UPI002716444A|nr:Sua5/YciO/YrdC/YwlC family protein [Conexibacter sp. CPCC 206217]MDO8213086.1 Sua5/YciO/YrdC/YwlC family protein [Conexibacter sp. CPCC 206217]